MLAASVSAVNESMSEFAWMKAQHDPQRKIMGVGSGDLIYSRWGYERNRETFLGAMQSAYAKLVWLFQLINRSKSKFAKFRPANHTTDVRISWFASCNATSERRQQANDLVARQDAVPLRQQFLYSLVPVLADAFQPTLLISPHSTWPQSPWPNTCGGDVAIRGFHPDRSTGRAPGPASWRYRGRSATSLRHTPANE